MVSKSRDDAWVVRVREIGETGKHVEAELSEADLAEIIGGPGEVYRTAGQGVEAFDLTRLNETVTLRGQVATRVGYACSRCLADNEVPVAVDLHWTYLPAQRFAASTTSEEEVELTSEDLDVSFYDGEEINLAETVREVLLLELGAYPVCAEACQTDNIAPPPNPNAAEPAPIDPRWAPLLAISKKQRS
jgi:uncharacterized protein